MPFIVICSIPTTPVCLAASLHAIHCRLLSNLRAEYADRSFNGPPAPPLSPPSPLGLTAEQRPPFFFFFPVSLSLSLSLFLPLFPPVSSSDVFLANDWTIADAF